jgi:hypothetical protein
MGSFGRGDTKRRQGMLIVLALGLHVSPSCILAEEINADVKGVVTVSSNTFLNSLGVNTHVDQGYDPATYVRPLQYLGVRNIRDSERNLPGLLMLHQQVGVRVDLLGFDVIGVTTAAKILAKSDALLSIEGPNEPNNFPITYNGQKGGGNDSWAAVAHLQKDLYAAVKRDPELRQYPVFHVSEGGAETDNVGLQFLKIPGGATALMPEGTEFADYANVHNYVSGIRVGYVDNQAWQAADPTLNGLRKGFNDHWDGLYGEYGKTWKRHFLGYSNAELEVLPRVTTETGWDAARPEEERVQGIVLLNAYLAQFKRGWKYTFIYELGEGEGGGGNQGLFHKDWTPKLAATYIHNLTSVLADPIDIAFPDKLDYAIMNRPSTVHDLLLQKSNGTFELIVWGEQVEGSNAITINLGGTRSKVKIYDMTVGVTPIQTLVDAANVPLTLNDHAMVVEIE